jgi:hypothetical protein
MGIHQGLCGFGSKLYAAWKGEIGDERLFYSVFDGHTWSAQKTIPGNSGVGPGLAATSAGTIFAAWKGEHTDNRLFYSSYSPSSQSWSNAQQISVASSCMGPSLGVIGNTVYAGWIGVDDDQTLYFASLNQSTGQWTNLPGVSGTGSTSVIGPSLAAIGHTLYAAWMTAGTGLSYAAFDTSTQKWSTAAAIPNVGSSIGPSLAAVGSTLYAAWKGQGDDQGIYYAAYNTSTKTWSGQTQISNIGSSIGPALAAIGTTLYALWIGENTDKSLYYASFNTQTSSWSAQATVPGNTGQDYVPPPVIGPAGGLGSNANYALQNNCNALQNPGIAVVVTQDIVVKNGGGFSFQLNAYSPQGEVCDWQQYILTVFTNPAKINWQVDNWGLNLSDNIINSSGTLASLASGTIPAGFKFWINLNTDGNNNVVSVDFSINQNNTLTTETIQLTSLYLISQQTGNPTTTKVGASDLAPIVAFELNLVGPDGSTATLSSGAGTITYTATNAMAPLNYLPSCIEWNGTTAETANSYYSPMTPTAATSLTQTFGVRTGATPQIHMAGPRLRFTPKAPEAG